MSGSNLNLSTRTEAEYRASLDRHKSVEITINGDPVTLCHCGAEFRAGSRRRRIALHQHHRAVAVRAATSQENEQ